jgi:hypothetical protein
MSPFLRGAASAMKARLLSYADRAQNRCRSELLRRLRSSGGERRRAIAVATLHTAEIREYSEISCAIHRLYCARHAYDYVELRELLDSAAAPTWNKPAAVSRLLRSEKKSYDYVMWIDADAAFNNHEIALDDIVDIWPEADFLISLDPANVIPRECCAGVFIVRNTPWSRGFIDEWLAAGRSMDGGKYFDRNRKGKKDQVILNRLLRRPDAAPHVQVLPSCYLNEDAHRSHGPSSFILHAMASSTAERRVVFERMYERLRGAGAGGEGSQSPAAART